MFIRSIPIIFRGLFNGTGMEHSQRVNSYYIKDKSCDQQPDGSRLKQLSFKFPIYSQE